MQEMVELSKLQSQQPEASPQAVSFQMKYATGSVKTITIQAGPSHFGINLKGNEAVTAPAVIIHPFRACSELPQGDKIKGKIAIMQRGDCMFVDKARRVQKAGAVAGIIVDSILGSSAETSPMFSMSGDGVDDVKIPVVFLFSQDASNLLLSLSKDPLMEITISEYKSDSNFWSSNSDESVFQKIKVSVQEFLNKHTGIAFTETVKYGSFEANIAADKIHVTYNKAEDEEVPKEENLSAQWGHIWKDMTQAILLSPKKHLFVPVNILRIYYQTLSGLTSEELADHDVKKQTLWLLKQLTAALYSKDDDILVPANQEVEVIPNQESSDSTLDNLLKLEDSRKRLEQLNSLFQAFKQIQKDVIEEFTQNSDDLVVKSERSPRDKIIITKEQIDASETVSDSKNEPKRNHANDEL